MISQPEILFVFLDCTSFIYRGTTYHLGSGYVQASLRQQGVKTRQLIVDSQVRLSDLVDMIIKQKPHIVGFTCYDSNYHISKLIARLLRKKQPGIITLMGGPSATFSDQLIMQDTEAVDACIRGEGEKTMGEVVERLGQNRNLAGIRGVTHRQDGQIIREPDRPYGCGADKADGLDMFPSPTLTDCFPFYDMSSSEIGRIGISTSRGCPYRCIYCNFASMSGHQMRYHSADRVVAELKVLDAAVGKLMLKEKLRLAVYDDIFTLDMKRVKQLCYRISKLELKNIKLYSETRADFVDRELLELMYKAGFTQVSFGLESASPRVLRIIKKVTSAPVLDNDFSPERKFLEQIKQAVGWCKEVGIKPTVNILLGLPTETLEEGLATLEFVKKLGVSEYYHNILQLHSGTEIFDKQAEYGISATPSVFKLPYDTKLRYNVRQVPVLDGGELCSTGNVAQEASYSHHLQRLMAIPMSKEGLPGYDVLINNPDLITQGFFRWLGNFTAPSTKLSIVNDNQNKFKQQESILNMVAADSPLLGISSLVQGDRWTKSVPEYVWHQGILPQEPYYQPYMHRFYHVPFGKLGRLADSMGSNDYNKRIMFFTLKDKHDRQYLIDLSECVAKYGFSALPAELVGSYGFFLNECCWQTEACPASFLSRLIIDDKEEVRTCLNGRTVGVVGDSLKDIKHNLLSLAKTKTKKRGCKQCSARSQCSGCLFPPVSDDEFCRLKREHHSISSLVKLMPYVRSAWLYNNLPPLVYRSVLGQLGTKDKHNLESLNKILGIKTTNWSPRPKASSSAPQTVRPS